MLQKTILLLLIFAVSLIMVIAFGFLNYRYKRRVIDYYVMFLIGVGWTILGLLFRVTMVIILGGGFAVIGYLKRGAWDEDLTGMRQANRIEIALLRKQTDTLELSFTLLIFLGITVLIGVILYMYLLEFGLS